MSDFENISFDFLQDKIREELHPTSGPGHEQKMLDINKKRLNNISLFQDAQKKATKSAEAEAVQLIKVFKNLMKKNSKNIDENLKSEETFEKLIFLSEKINELESTLLEKELNLQDSLQEAYDKFRDAYQHNINEMITENNNFYEKMKDMEDGFSKKVHELAIREATK